VRRQHRVATRWIAEHHLLCVFTRLPKLDDFIAPSREQPLAIRRIRAVADVTGMATKFFRCAVGREAP
jgi:hypothetical protein